jgi:Flp pilus assembly protein TadD
LQPDNQRYVYVYSVALHSAGRRDEAVAALKQALENHPNDRDILSALIAFHREAGDTKAVLVYAERLATISPEDNNLQNFIRDLRRSSIP